MKRIYLSPPHMGGNEQEYVNEAFKTNWIAPVGPHLQQFEEKLSERLGEGYHAAALNSGTSAIHLALKIVGVKKGDTVLCQSFTFAGSANPIMYEHALPVFIDSEKDTWNMDPVLLEQAIVELSKEGIKPSAIIYVHLYGMPARIKEIMGIARKHDIPLIEDAAESLGSVYDGKQTGSFGDIGVFSFNGNKIITTSGGGALVSENKEWVQKARFLSTQARDEALHYQHSQLGYNYRLSNVSAAIGLGQLEVLEERVREKRKIHSWYMNRLKDTDYIEFLDEPADAYSNRWLTTILVHEKEKRQRLMQLFHENNIECRPVWKPMHLQPVFSDCRSFENGASGSLFSKGLCLPSGTSMTEENYDRISNVFSIL